MAFRDGPPNTLVITHLKKTYKGANYKATPYGPDGEYLEFVGWGETEAEALEDFEEKRVRAVARSKNHIKELHEYVDTLGVFKDAHKTEHEEK
jgi:hypothetical protein